MESQTKILVLHHSGAGSTRALAEIFYNKLNMYCCDIDSIKMNYNYSNLQKYGFFILAFPTYHCEPSRSMKEFIANMPSFTQQKRAFVFTTCGLYFGNSVRMFIKECFKKNIMVCGNSVYRAPATDGSLLLPNFKFMFKYEKNLVRKLKRDINIVQTSIEKDMYIMASPTFKLYTLLNYPNKALGKAYKHNISLIKEECIRCNGCVEGCIRGGWEKNQHYPQFNVGNCEFCFKCIHHCPKNALVLSSKTVDKPKLNKKFYAELKENILKEWDT